MFVFFFFFFEKNLQNNLFIETFIFSILLLQFIYVSERNVSIFFLFSKHYTFFNSVVNNAYYYLNLHKYLIF